MLRNTFGTCKFCDQDAIVVVNDKPVCQDHLDNAFEDLGRLRLLLGDVLAEPHGLPVMPAKNAETELLLEWMRWWAATDWAPTKLPNALHVRTGLHLQLAGYDVGGMFDADRHRQR